MAQYEERLCLTVANLVGDATNWKTVRLIVAELRVDVDTVEVQVPSVGA